MRKLVRLWIFALLPSVLLANPLKVSVSADAAILVDLKNGNVLFEKNADRVHFPASITKVATALFILDKFGHRLNEQAVAKPTALGWAPVDRKRHQPERYPSYLLESGATHVGIQPGEILPLVSLLEALLIGSANDAANVLAEHFCGSVPKFMEEMNIYLASKGFTHSHFDNPHGLHHVDHCTTAREMAGMAREAMKFPIFRAIVKKEKGLKPKTNLSDPFPYGQGNLLLRRGRYYYPHATGIKTGYTSLAKCTLVASAEKEDRQVLAVLLGCQANENRYRDAATLFDSAFAEKKTSRLLLTKEHDIFTLGLKGGRIPLKAQMIQDLSIDYYPSAEPQAKTIVEWDAQRLPIRAGEVVGAIRLVDEHDALITKMPLVAIERVDPKLSWKIRHYAGVIASMKLTKAIFLAMLIVSALAAWLFFRLKAT